MPKLFEEIKRLENLLKKENPKARLLWREYYFEALKYAPTPQDVKNMSLSDLIEFVGQKRRFYADMHQSGTTVASDKFFYPQKMRHEIVIHYRQEWAAGRVANKEAWAQNNYMITGRTLRNYEHEFPEEN